jgi:hypothetical protein
MNWIKKVLLPENNRFTYWLFFLTAFPINLAEGVPWYNWIINPFIFAWAAVGMKLALFSLIPLEFRPGLGRRLVLAIVIIFIVYRFL